jgi:hypothetical protein
MRIAKQVDYRLHFGGTSSSDLALAKLDSYTSLTLEDSSRWIPDERLGYYTDAPEQYDRPRCFGYTTAAQCFGYGTRLQ